MDSPIYGIIVDTKQPISSDLFMKRYSELLEDILDDPDARIFLSDIGPGSIFVARFLKKRYYRNATLHHVGDKPRINIADLPLKGGFKTRKECQSYIQKNSTHLIHIKNEFSAER